MIVTISLFLTAHYILKSIYVNICDYILKYPLIQYIFWDMYDPVELEKWDGYVYLLTILTILTQFVISILNDQKNRCKLPHSYSLNFNPQFCSVIIEQNLSWNKIVNSGKISVNEPVVIFACAHNVARRNYRN